MKIAAERIVGRSPDVLTLSERWMLAGKWIALEVYSPLTLPLREIAALGDSAAECAEQLRAAGLDPTNFEYVVLTPPY